MPYNGTPLLSRFVRSVRKQDGYQKYALKCKKPEPMCHELSMPYACKLSSSLSSLFRATRMYYIVMVTTIAAGILIAAARCDLVW